MTRHKSLTLAVAAVSVAATSGCATIQRHFAFLHLPHFGHHQYATTQYRPIAPLASQTAEATPVDGYYDEAAKAIMRKDYAAALDILQQARAKKADDVRVLNAFGVVYDKLGRFDLSTRYYAEARALDPGSTIIANNMAYSLIMQQQQTLQPKTVVTAQVVDPAPVYRMAANVSLPVADPGVDPSLKPTQPKPAAPALVVDHAPTYRVAASFTPPVTDPIVDLKLTGPGSVQAIAAQVFEPLLVTPKPQGALLQRASFTSTAALSSPRIDPLTVSEPQAEMQTQTQPGAAAFAAVHAFSPPPAPVKGRIVAIAPGVMRLELGSTPAPVMLLPRSPAAAPASKGLMLTGHPLMVVDATGRTDGAVRLRDTLVERGWAIKVATIGPVAPHTVIRYDRDNLPVAQGLARSLPFPVQLAECTDACSGVKLVIGADALDSKPAPRHAERRRAARA